MSVATPENRADQVPRLANGRWLRGVSGNPGGRPRVIANLRDLARSYTGLAISTLAAIAASGATEMARISAARELLDRGWGKPPVAVELREQLEPEDFAERFAVAMEHARGVMAPVAAALPAPPEDQSRQSVTLGGQAGGGVFRRVSPRIK